ncbi:MAG: GNAT family N-acetyltransferase [Methanosarcinales archaeon]|jgi:GNAT superfamily N-acetyltransferase|nr:GNAT family N-acetyltransferase [Methanosarcinales archaeon]
MHQRFPHDELRVILYAQHHDISRDISRFESDSPELNAFLKEDALKNQTELVSKTYLCYHFNKLIGYITFATDILKAEEMLKETRIEGIPYKEYPAIKIARLATDKKYKRMGVGTFLLKVAVGKAYDISDRVGCRFITVDSKQESIGFYKKSGGFKLVTGHEKKTYPTMYLDIIPVIKELKPTSTELDDFS